MKRNFQADYAFLSIGSSDILYIADYAVANNLTAEPAICWCVALVLKKRERILKKVKSKYWPSNVTQVWFGTPEKGQSHIGD
jgi:hypothetical protein